MLGCLPEHLRSARPVERVACVDGDGDVRRVVTELDDGVSGVVDDGVEASLDAAAHFSGARCALASAIDAGMRDLVMKRLMKTPIAMGLIFAPPLSRVMRLAAEIRCPTWE